MQLGKWYRDRANATVSKLEAARGQIESAGMVRAADSGRFGRMDGRQCVLPVTVRAATHHDVGYERRETRVSISARYAAPLWNARLLTLCVALCVPETANEPPGGEGGGGGSSTPRGSLLAGPAREPARCLFLFYKRYDFRDWIFQVEGLRCKISEKFRYF